MANEMIDLPVEEILELRNKGKSIKEIAERYSNQLEVIVKKFEKEGKEKEIPEEAIITRILREKGYKVSLKEVKEAFNKTGSAQSIYEQYKKQKKVDLKLLEEFKRMAIEQGEWEENNTKQILDEMMSKYIIENKK